MRTLLTSPDESFVIADAVLVDDEEPVTRTGLADLPGRRAARPRSGTR